MTKTTSKKDLPNDPVPQHIALIMDGNRRWARHKGLADVEGHKAGAENLERVVEAAGKMGVKTVTVYALSTENIRERAAREVRGIFNVLRQGYKTNMQRMMENGVKIDVLGERKGLPKSIQNMIDGLRGTVIQNESIKLNIALNYGGKKELVEAFKDMIKDGVNVEKVNEKVIDEYLYTTGQPDPELVIRTGGRVRLSNFLIWQTAYSELYFTTKYWPDFGPKDLETAIKWYQSQKRNFGR